MNNKIQHINQQTKNHKLNIQFIQIFLMLILLAKNNI